MIQRGVRRTVLIMLVSAVALAPAASKELLSHQTQRTERPAPRPAPQVETPVPTMRGLGGGIAPETAGLMATRAGEAQALEVVVRFLDLGPDQIEGLLRLLLARQQAVLPLVHGIVEREILLHQLLEDDPDATAVGILILEIRSLYARIAGHQRDFLTAFETLLPDEQLQRFRALHLARELQPLLPAFDELGLL